MENQELYPIIEDTETGIISAEDVEIVSSSALDDGNTAERIADKLIDTLANEAQPNPKVVESIMNDQSTPLNQRVDCTIKYEESHGREFRKNVGAVAAATAGVLAVGIVVKKLSDEGVL